MNEKTTVTKPWGYYVDLDEDRDDGWKCKRLEVNPNARLSYQRHNNRSEVWVMVSGYADVTLDHGGTARLNQGDRLHIKPNHWHRLAAGPEGCTVIEVQMGQCDEDDIQRMEDDYGRADK